MKLFVIHTLVYLLPDTMNRLPLPLAIVICLLPVLISILGSQLSLPYISQLHTSILFLICPSFSCTFLISLSFPIQFIMLDHHRTVFSSTLTLTSHYNLQNLKTYIFFHIQMLYLISTAFSIDL